MTNTIASTLEHLDVSSIPQELRVELLSQMTEVALKRVAVEAAERLSPDDQDELLKLQESSKEPSEIEAFVRERIPDYDALVETTLNGFLEEMQWNLKTLQTTT